MTPLRLCFVGPAASVNLRRWVEWFARRGHEATVVTVEPAEPHLITGFRQVNIEATGVPRKVGRLVSAVRLLQMLRRLKPDVVHVHYLRGLAWGLVLKPACPCVATPWGSDILEEQGAFKEWYSRSLTRRLLRRADLVTTHSAFMEAKVRELAPEVRALVRIGWGVDLERFKPGLDVRIIRERWKIGEQQRVILSPRLAQPFYNHARVIRALPKVCEQVPGSVLVITEQFADHVYVRGLQRLAAELGVLERVKFVGAIPYEDMPRWLNLADAVVMVPNSDGMPNTLIETMACGAVPVLNRLPQYAEVIRDCENGCFVDEDEGSLADALVRVLSDAGFRAKVSTRNRATAVEIADQNREMSKMEGFYANLVAATG
ncbi:MAG: glycosyltransferase family 4 protein [Nitrospirota bacterium]